jgi:hypothetical protein
MLCYAKKGKDLSKDLLKIWNTEKYLKKYLKKDVLVNCG